MTTNAKQYKTNIDFLSLKKNKTDIKKVAIKSSKDAEAYARQFYFEDLGIYESVFILLLNQSNTTIAFAKISQGGICSTITVALLLLCNCVPCQRRTLVSWVQGNFLPSNNNSPNTLTI